MSNLERFKQTDVRYSRLKAFTEFANLYQLETFKAYNYRIGIKDMYFDYGQNWWYTGLITIDEDKESDWQSLCPRDHDLVCECDSIEKLKAMAEYYIDHLDKGEIGIYLYKVFE